MPCGASTSSLCVCQFRHLRNGATNRVYQRQGREERRRARRDDAYFGYCGGGDAIKTSSVRRLVKPTDSYTRIALVLAAKDVRNGVSPRSTIARTTAATMALA